MALLALLPLLCCGGCRENGVPPAIAPPPPTPPGVPGMQAPPPRSDGEGVGKRLPDFSVTDIDGGQHTLGSYGGRILVLEFWASYCKPCLKRLEDYRSHCDSYHRQGVEYLALSMDESDEAIKNWRQQPKYQAFPIPLARVDDTTQTAFFGDLQLVPIPQTRIADRKGIVRYSFGPDSKPEDVTAALDALLVERQ